MCGRFKRLRLLLEEFRRRNRVKRWPGLPPGAVDPDGAVHIHCGYHEYKTRVIAMKLTEWPPFRDFCREEGARWELAVKPNKYTGQTRPYAAGREKYIFRTEVTVRFQ